MSTSPILTSSLAPTYICQHCRQTLMPQGPPLIGEKPEEKQGRIAKMLAEHLGEHHKNVLGSLMVAGNDLFGWLVFQQFKFSEIESVKACEEYRVTLRSRTQRVKIDDAKIEAQINTFWDSMVKEAGSERAAVIAALKTLRNAMEEQASA